MVTRCPTTACLIIFPAFLLIAAPCSNPHAFDQAYTALHTAFSMAKDGSDVVRLLHQLRQKGIEYFTNLEKMGDDDVGKPSYDIESLEPDHYWSKISEVDRQLSGELRSELMGIVSDLANNFKFSSILAEADKTDLSIWTKSTRASLRLRKYESWDSEVLHDEGVVLGVRPAGQSDNVPEHPRRAKKIFDRGISYFLELAELLDVPPVLRTTEAHLNPQATSSYEPGTAFVMMNIDPNNADLQDRYDTIKECFSLFDIEARRVDEMEHSDVITEKICERIRVSEFLIADLTEERPSVYYEVGYAHALGRSVIMYRRQNSKLHFDLAAYNCPDYRNLAELKSRLVARLEEITNRRPKGAGR